MAYAIQNAVWTLAQPSNLLLLLLLIGALLLWTRRYRPGRVLVAGAVLLMLSLGLLPVHTAVTAPLENYYPAPASIPDDIAGILVLGGAERLEVTLARGQPTLNQAAERLTAAAVLAARYPELPVVVTGGKAQVAKEFLEQFGVTEPQLIVEDQASDTYRNATLTRDLLEPGPDEQWLLVTSAMHMPRAVNVFRSAGWTVVPYPVDYTTTGELELDFSRRPLGRLVQLDRAVTEWAGLVGYRLAGRTDRLLPERP